MKKIRDFFSREQNLLIHIIASFFAILLGLFLKINLSEWMLIFFVIALVITSELINSSIELVVDLYTDKFNSLAMVAKDVAAGAVLISAITALCVGIYVFFPKINMCIF